MKTLAPVLILLLAACGRSPATANLPQQAPPPAPANPVLAPTRHAPVANAPAQPARDVSADIAAAKAHIRKRERDDLPPMGRELARSTAANVDRAIDQAFAAMAADLTRLAQSLSTDLPVSERVRILVAKADEITGWGPKSVIPRAK